MADWITLLGYASGVYFIKPDLDVHALAATVLAVHLCDGVLCLVIARHSGRNRVGWTLAGLVLGVWGTLPLLLQGGAPDARAQADAPSTRRPDPRSIRPGSARDP